MGHDITMPTGSADASLDSLARVAVWS
jgi:hypothetical protein